MRRVGHPSTTVAPSRLHRTHATRLRRGHAGPRGGPMHALPPYCEWQCRRICRQHDIIWEFSNLRPRISNSQRSTWKNGAPTRRRGGDCGGAKGPAGVRHGRSRTRRSRLCTSQGPAGDAHDALSKHRVRLRDQARRPVATTLTWRWKGVASKAASSAQEHRLPAVGVGRLSCTAARLRGRQCRTVG